MNPFLSWFIDEISFEYFGVRIDLAVTSLLILIFGIIVLGIPLDIVDPHQYTSNFNKILIPAIPAVIIEAYLSKFATRYLKRRA